MKRVLSFLILIALLISLSACGGAAVPAASEQNQPDSAATAAEEPTAEPVAVEATPEPIPETTLADADWANLTVTSITEDGQGGYDFAFSLKSKLDVGTSAYIDLFINGWLLADNYFSISADPNAEKTGQFNVPADYFTLCGIDSVNEIVLQFSIYKADYSDSLKDSIAIFPAGEEAAKSAPAYQYVAKDNDIPLFESEDAIAAVTGFAANDANSYTMTLYVENTSNRDLNFYLSNCGVNEYYYPMSYNSPRLTPGTRFILVLPFDADTLAKEGISEITRIDLGFNVVDSNDYSDLIKDSKTFYPSGTETPRIERTPVEGEVVLVDNEDFIIIATACLDHPGSSRYGIGFYVENKTDKEVSIEVQNAEVNGEPCMSNGTIAELPAGMRSNVVYTWNTDAFEKAGLAKDAAVEQVMLPVYIFSDGNRKAGDEVYQHNFKIKVW